MGEKDSTGEADFGVESAYFTIEDDVKRAKEEFEQIQLTRIYLEGSESSLRQSREFMGSLTKDSQEYVRTRDTIEYLKSKVEDIKSELLFREKTYAKMNPRIRYEVELKYGSDSEITPV